MHQRNPPMSLPSVETESSSGCIIALADARARLRPAMHGPGHDAIVAGHSDGHADDEYVIQPLCDAVLMLFHLLAEHRDPFACRDLRNAVRRAVNVEPMAEVAEIRASTWTSIKDIGFLAAQLASRRRFDEAWGDN
jgi:hypothetical protein